MPCTVDVAVAGDPLSADDVQPHPKYHLLQLPNPSTGHQANSGCSVSCVVPLAMPAEAQRMTQVVLLLTTTCVVTTGGQQQYVLTNNGLLEVNRVRHAASSWLVDQSFVSGTPSGCAAVGASQSDWTCCSSSGLRHNAATCFKVTVRLSPDCGCTCCSAILQYPTSAVAADGSAYLATPINPVFVLVALLNITPDQQVSKTTANSVQRQAPVLWQKAGLLSSSMYPCTVSLWLDTGPVSIALLCASNYLLSNMRKSWCIPSTVPSLMLLCSLA